MPTQEQVNAMYPTALKIACLVAAIWLFFWEKNYVGAAIFALAAK